MSAAVDIFLEELYSLLSTAEETTRVLPEEEWFDADGNVLPTGELLEKFAELVPSEMMYRPTLGGWHEGAIPLVAPVIVHENTQPSLHRLQASANWAWQPNKEKYWKRKFEQRRAHLW